MLLKLSLFILLWCYHEVQGWGYRYNYNPGTGESNLWTFLPGHEQPVVYAYQPGQAWPQIYTVGYDGLLPGQPSLPSKAYHGKCHLTIYTCEMLNKIEVK